MILLDYFWVFGWISGKRVEIRKIWANFGVLRRGIGIPHSSVGPHQGVACPLHGVAECRSGPASGTLRCSFAKWR